MFSQYTAQTSFEGVFNISIPANIYLFKVNNKNTRRYEICLKFLTIKTPERRRCSSVFIVNFENISLFF